MCTFEFLINKSCFSAEAFLHLIVEVFLAAEVRTIRLLGRMQNGLSAQPGLSHFSSLVRDFCCLTLEQASAKTSVSLTVSLPSAPQNWSSVSQGSLEEDDIQRLPRLASTSGSRTAPLPPGLWPEPFILCPLRSQPLQLQ